MRRRSITMSSSHVRPRSIRTCTECKQTKLRCDSRANFPNPCSRCRSRGLFCTVDATFQRTPARKKLEALNREIQELRSRQHADSLPSPVASGTESASKAEESDLLASSQDKFELRTPTVTLGRETLESQQITDALEIFAEVFQPQLPLLGHIDAHELYNKHPFLFWTMVLIVLSHMNDTTFNQVDTILREPYMELLQRHVLAAPLPLHTIQALLFLCMWPLPVRAQEKDPSWLYYGIASQAARHMGLDREQHLPSLRTPGVSSETARARINTWLGCFHVGTSLSLHLGLRPPIESELDFTIIHTFLGQGTVSLDTATLIRINLVVAKFISVLQQNTIHSVGSSLMKLINSELDILKNGIQGDERGASRVEFSALVTKLHFYALLTIKSSCYRVSRETILQAGLASAFRAISIASAPERIYSGIDDKDGISFIQRQRSLPKTYYRGLVFATIYVITFSYLSSTTTPEEHAAATAHIAQAQGVLRRCSIVPKDEYARTATFFEILTRLPPGSFDSGQICPTHRMGVSILENAASIVNEVRSRPAELADKKIDSPIGFVGQLQQTQSESLEEQEDIPNDEEQVNLSLEFLKEYWDDPIISMFHLDNANTCNGLSE